MRVPVAGMIAVAAAFVVVLPAAFWIHERTPGISDDLFGTMVAISIAAISGLLVCLMLGMSPWKGVARRLRTSRAAPVIRDERAEAERLAAQRAYAADTNATAACVHLQPIEHAMRLAGVEVRLCGISEYGPIVKAACRIDDAELRRMFELPEWVAYREAYSPERSPWDNPHAYILCARCFETDRSRCNLSVLHPSECREDTPWFPVSGG